MSHTLAKSLSPLQLWGIVVGMVISGMYFGWNYALQYTSPIGFIISVLIVTLFYTSFMFSYAELSTAIPHAGGSMEFAKRTMGPFGGFITGFAVFLEFLFAVPAIALSIGAYIHFLTPAIPIVAAAVVVYAIFVFINCLGVKTAAVVELVITIIAIAGIAIYAIGGAGHIQSSNIFTKNLFFGGLPGIFSAIPFAIWFYLGAEGGAMAAEECKEPKKNIPLGFNLGIITLAIMAIVTLLVTTGISNAAKINNVDSPLPSALAFVYGANSFFSKALSFIGLFGLIASLHGLIIGYSRQMFAMAREGFFPYFLSTTTPKHKTPIWALILPSLAGLIFVLTKATATIIVISSIGAVVMYIMSMICFFLLRSKEPQLERPYKVAHISLPIIALVIAALFMFAVTYANLSTMLWVVATFAAAALFYLVYAKTHMKKVAALKDQEEAA
ncbi:MAG TPA: ethanolamine permease [Firmicutes bacterium]|jgi:ethanolamine permease|nr:ethanolamine permease [Bacillota bacterium]